MKRTTISLPDELASALRREARRRNMSRSKAVRDALNEHPGLLQDGTRAPAFAALGADGTRTTAGNAEWVRAHRR